MAHIFLPPRLNHIVNFINFILGNSFKKKTHLKHYFSIIFFGDYIMARYIFSLPGFGKHLLLAEKKNYLLNHSIKSNIFRKKSFNISLVRDANN